MLQSALTRRSRPGRWAPAVAVLILALLLPVLPAHAAGTRLVSFRQTLSDGKGTGGGKNARYDGHSTRPSISADGDLVVFQSDASYFDKLEDNNVSPEKHVSDSDIYLHRVSTGTTVRLSISYDGKEADGASYNPQISPNGRWVVFESDARNLVTDDNNHRRDVFLIELEKFLPSQGEQGVQRVSLNKDGGEIVESSFGGSVADSGAVVFQSAAGDVVDGMNNSKSDIFLRSGGKTQLLTKGLDGAPADGGSYGAHISGDSQFVTFASLATNIAANDTNGKMDVFRHELAKGKSELVSVAKSGAESANGASYDPSISYHGNFISFTSVADDLVLSGGGGGASVYLRDMSIAKLKTRRVGQGWDAEVSTEASKSGKDEAKDGSFVVYRNESGAIYKYSGSTGKKELASLTAKEELTSGENPAVSANGRYITFDSIDKELKDNYLGRGLVKFTELYNLNISKISLCDDKKNECSGVYIRDSVSPVEPGPTGTLEPLLDVSKTESAAAMPTKLTFTLERDFKSHEFKDIDFLLPVGMAASTNFPDCASEEAAVDACPSSSRVGDVHVDVELINNLQAIPPVYGYVYMTKEGMNGGVYFAEPMTEGEAGLLYAVVNDTDFLTKPIVVPLRIKAIPGSLYRLKVSAADIPNSVDDAIVQQYNFDNPPIKLDEKLELGTVYPNIKKIKVTIDGNRLDENGYPFLTNPSFSTASPEIPQKLKGVEATFNNYGGSSNERFATYPVTDEEKLPFNPKLSIELSNPKPGRVIDLTTSVSKPLTITDFRRATVTLPKGVWVNSLAGVGYCTVEQVNSWQGGSKPCGELVGPVGSASIKTPIIDLPLGEAYLVDTGSAGAPLKIAVFFDDPRIPLKLEGEVKLTKERRIQVTFSDIPPYPVTKFTLTVAGLLKLSDGLGCEKKLTAEARFEPWSAKVAPKDVTAIDQASASTCGQDGNSQFGPGISVVTGNTTAGQSPGKVKVNISKVAEDDPMTGFDLLLPPGFVGDLDATAKCDAGNALNDGCPESSRIGDLSATAQITKGKLIKVDGAIYNALPAGADFGSFVSIFNLPEIAGGDKLVIVSSVNPTANVNSVKTKIDGMPPEFNMIEMDLELNGALQTGDEGPLLFNPTFCADGNFTLDSRSYLSLNFTGLSPYRASLCPLPFAPKLSVTQTASRAGDAVSVETTVGQNKDETAPRSLKMSFTGLGVDIGKIATCSDVQMAQSTCPADSKVASVQVGSWLVAKPLYGDLYLKEGLKQAFLNLKGPISLDLTGDVVISPDGSVSITFDSMPPISGSQISATTRQGLFKLPRECKGGPKVSLEATSYSGQKVSEEQGLTCMTSSGNPTIDLKVSLSPKRKGRPSRATFTVSQSDRSKPEAITDLTLRLGRGKSRLKVAGGALKRMARRLRGPSKGRNLGVLRMVAEGGRTVKAPINLNGKGTLKLATRNKSLRKVRIKLSGNSFVLRKLPATTGKGAGRAGLYRYSIVLNSKRAGYLRNPGRAGKVRFGARAKTAGGRVMRATRAVRVR